MLQRVAGEISAQCEIGIVRDNQVVYADSMRGAPQQGVKFDPSRGAPIHCTSTGKIYMSRLPARARDKLVCALPLPRTLTLR